LQQDDGGCMVIALAKATPAYLRYTTCAAQST
jgi:hypothetical protein